MAFDCKERKPLLYADLFKPKPKTTASDCSSWTESLPCDSSSSSGLSTPFGSEFESSESDDGDFTAELTRQMAECMLRDDDEDEDRAYSSPDSISQVYQVEIDQPRVKKQAKIPASSSRGRRVKRTELTRQSLREKTEQAHGGYRGRDWRVAKVQTGSDMRVVFLGGPGSRPGFTNGSTGTGVFLPRATKEPVPVQPKKKAGCPTVLIPTRVLEVLEQHFNRFPDSAGPPLRGGSNYAKDEGHISKGRRNRHSHAANKDEEMQLPQEWTY